MKLKFIAEKYLKTATGKNKLVTDNSIQANHLNIGKYVEEDYMKQYHGIEEITAVQEVAISLPKEMDSTAYDIQLTVEDVDIATPAVGKLVPYVKTGTKTTTSFTARLFTVLAAGETVKIHWKVLG